MALMLVRKHKPIICHSDERSEEDRQRFRDRQQQIELAKKRGEQHLGR